MLSCHNQPEKTLKKDQLEQNKMEKPVEITNRKEVLQGDKGIQLMQQYCFSCHPGSMQGGMGMGSSAPPMSKVQKQYKMASVDKQQFVKLVSDWVKHPDPSKMLLTRASFIFGQMPALQIPDQDLELIAAGLYEINYPAHKSRMRVRLPLNKGRKWHIGKAQMKQFEQMVQMLKNFQGENVADYRQLGWDIVAAANRLILNPEQSGKIRTKYYLFFYEIEKDIRALQSAKNIKEAKKYQQILLPELMRYQNFFEA